MGHWEYKIRVKSLVGDEDTLTVEELKEKTGKFWKQIKSYQFMEDFVDEYEFFYPKEAVDTIEVFNELLSHLYDYCDFNSVWVG